MAKKEEKLWKEAEEIQRKIQNESEKNEKFEAQKILKVGEIKSLNEKYQELLEKDKGLEKKIDDMVKSKEYKRYMAFLSEEYFSKNEDFFT